jgi:predicted HicB family RNase H-like nuclease
MAKGTVVIRMPTELHEKLLELAAEQGVSMNQLAVALLAGSVGFKLTEEIS